MATQSIEQAEIWKEIPSLNFTYAVSDHGRVKRLKPACGATVGKILKPKLSNKGYWKVNLSWRDSTGSRHTRIEYVHRLVAEVFVGPQPPGKVVNHKDGVKLHNHPSNLEWVTRSENDRHAYSMGLRKTPPPESALRGERAPGAKLRRADVTEIRLRIQLGESNRSIARSYGVTAPLIQHIKLGKIWRE